MHTPGPWRPNDNADVVLESDDAMVIAWCSSPDVEMGDEHKANARLIASAPDLLEALKHSLRWVSVAPGSDAQACTRKIEAAIAKAEGKS